MTECHFDALRALIWQGIDITSDSEELQRQNHASKLLTKAGRNSKLDGNDYTRSKAFLDWVFKADNNLVTTTIKRSGPHRLTALGVVLRIKKIPRDMRIIEILIEKAPSLPWYGDTRLLSDAVLMYGKENQHLFFAQGKDFFHGH
jgi:hypothetical protein